MKRVCDEYWTREFKRSCDGFLPFGEQFYIAGVKGEARPVSIFECERILCISAKELFHGSNYDLLESPTLIDIKLFVNAMQNRSILFQDKHIVFCINPSSRSWFNGMFLMGCFLMVVYSRTLALCG
jgi:hypothetical protein